MTTGYINIVQLSRQGLLLHFQLEINLIYDFNLSRNFFTSHITILIYLDSESSEVQIYLNY